ncbi:MAG: EamA family transporter [Rhodoferax ferrireducens]|uniref:EamA family transporter n=2 Tax=Pseudomonadota TaxID=1224 RepID=A0A1Y1R0M7_9GAMM|nr:MAG: EamA family transporter [Rhodoferax ferrireducens]OQX17375.1 MAG: EamA family transporter [Thiothrix lacustris]
MHSTTRASLLALGAIALWGSLAALGVALGHVPPFLLTGLSLLIGSLVALPLSGFNLARWRVPLPTLALGIYGLFAYHFLLFLALRHAPPVQANLVNYLWPLLIVVLAPVLLPGMTLRPVHIFAALLGFAGAAVVILGGPRAAGAVSNSEGLWAWGYVPALGAALIWASYSLLTKRVAAFPTAAIGSFALASGLLSLLCHAFLEPATTLSGQDWLLIAIIGLGPMGAAFFLWDKALKLGDARHIGILSYLTPLLSTGVLTLVSHKPLTWNVGVAAGMIVAAAWLGTRAR